MDTRFRRVAAALVVALTAFGLAGCSRSTDDAGAEGDEKVVKIGLIVPITGSLSTFGLGMKNAVDLAVNQANAADKIKGWNIVFAPEDDGAKADQGAAAANKLASDSAVAGVVGTLNSSVAQQTAPILQRAGIAQVSPANSNPSLTRGPDDANPTRVWDNFFRLCAIDSLQGPFLADYTFKTANLKTVVTVNDTKTYGKGLAEAFEKQFEANGGQILSRETIATGDRDFGALVAKINGLNPDFVFYGGEAPEAAPLSAQLGQGGFAGPVVGGDGMQSAEFATGGGRDGDLATSFGAPTAKLETAKKFIDDYRAAGYSEDYEAYGALAYDAANVLIEALAEVLPEASSVEAARPDIIKALAETRDFQGITGTTTFDEFGDTSNKVLTVNKVEGTKWTDVYFANYAEGS